MLTRRSAIASAAAAAIAPRVARAQQLIPIKLGLTRSDAQVAVECGFETGIFRDAGIDLDIQTLGNQGLVMSGVISGALDVGIADGIQLGNAVQRKIPIGGIAGGAMFTPEAPTLVLVSLKSGPIRTAKDLNGNTVGVITLQSQSSVAVTEWLRTRGADVPNVKLYEIPLAQMIPALKRGLIAAAFLGEPFLSSNKDELFTLGLPFEAIAKNFYLNTYFATRAWVASNRDIARKLVSALYDSARWTNTHTAERVAIEARWTKIEPERLATMVHNMFSTTLEARYYQPVVDIAIRYHLIPAHVAAADMLISV